MPYITRQFAKSVVVLAATGLVITGCTNASEATDTTPSDATSAVSFDPNTVQKNDSLASQLPPSIKSKGTLVIGSDTTYPPAQFLGGTGSDTPMGYDVDIAEAIGRKLGLEVDTQTAEFTGILPALGPKYDLGISSFAITNERLEVVNFVRYYNVGAAWAVQKGNPKEFSPSDVCGKSIGVQTATFEADMVKALDNECTSAGKEAVEIITLSKQTDLNSRLVNGALDGMIASSPVIGYVIQETDGAIERVGETTEVVPVGIAVAKNDIALAELIEKVMNELISDGTYKKILDTWNTADGAVTEAELNPVIPS